ncbi:MAG TPA: ribosome biogenesis factor YjgA [Rhodocyclaceae bacterium]
MSPKYPPIHAAGDAEIPSEEEDFYDRPSKSQIKREMEALQDMGEALVALSTDRLKKIDIPDRLRDAVRDAQRFTSHGARRRQMQYIGKLMRDVDTAPIQAALDEVNGVSAAATAKMHRLEQLRLRVLENESVLGEIVRDHPAADLQHLRQLRRNALKEQEQGKPPRAFRELFKVLRDMEAKPTDAAAEENEDE